MHSTEMKNVHSFNTMAIIYTEQCTHQAPQVSVKTMSVNNFENFFELALYVKAPRQAIRKNIQEKTKKRTTDDLKHTYTNPCTQK